MIVSVSPPASLRSFFIRLLSKKSSFSFSQKNLLSALPSPFVFSVHCLFGSAPVWRGRDTRNVSNGCLSMSCIFPLRSLCTFGTPACPHTVPVLSPLRPSEFPDEIFRTPSVLCHQSVTPFPFEPFVFCRVPVMEIIVTFPTYLHHRTVLL